MVRVGRCLDAARPSFFAKMEKLSDYAYRRASVAVGSGKSRKMASLGKKPARARI